MSRYVRLLGLVTVFVSSTVAAEDALDVSPKVRHIVGKALPAIRSGGAEWIADQDCLSCHRVAYQVWSLNRAAESGYPTDDGQLMDWNNWATEWTNMVNPKRRGEIKKNDALRRESDTLAQLLLGRPADDEAEWVENYRRQLLNAQQESGSWKPAGQLPKQKRPERETEEVTTMWALLGLHASGMEKKELSATMEKARRWLGEETLGQSTEWWATKLLLERTDGNAAQANELRSVLLKKQHADGGWGWLTKEDSDAIGTGVALYALAQDGVKLEEPAIRKAVAFLEQSQEDDGSWNVNGTKESYRDEVTETASFWGTCWAVIGLLEFNRDRTIGDNSGKYTSMNLDAEGETESDKDSASRKTFPFRVASTFKLSDGATHLDVSSDGTTVAAVAGSSVFILRDGKKTAKWSCPKDVSDLAISPDGSKIAIVNQSPEISVYDCSTGKTVSILSRKTAADYLRNDRQLRAAMYPGGKSLISTGSKQRLYVSDVTSGEWQYVMFMKYRGAQCEVSPSGKHAVLFGKPNPGELSGHLTMFAVRQGLQPLWTKWHQSEGEATWSVFRSDGRQIATGGAGDGARIWDVDSGESIQHLPLPERTIGASFVTDSQLLVGTTDDLLLGDLLTGATTHRIVHEIDHMDASADGTTVITSNRNGIDFWQHVPNTTGAIR